MRKEYKGIIKVISPLHHGSDENAGIDRLYRRMDIFVNGKVERIPIISGNSIRGLMRDLLAYHFIQTVGIESLTLGVYDLLFAGGSLSKGAKVGKVEVQKINQIREMLPSLRLLGGALSNHIMGGEFNCGIAWLVSSETEFLTGIPSTDSYFMYLSEDFGTRKDNLLKDGNIVAEKRQNPIQMKYNCEVVMAGAEFAHSFQLLSSNDLVKSCLMKGIALLKNYGHLGGKAAIGYGEVLYRYEDSDTKENGDIYEKFLVENKKEIIDVVKSIA